VRQHAARLHPLELACCELLDSILNCDLRLTRRAVLRCVATLQHPAWERSAKCADAWYAHEATRRTGGRTDGASHVRCTQTTQRSPPDRRAKQRSVECGGGLRSAAKPCVCGLSCWPPSESERRRWEPPEHGRVDELPAAHASHESAEAHSRFFCRLHPPCAALPDRRCGQPQATSAGIVARRYVRARQRSGPACNCNTVDRALRV
jgi:hypothetical protein